MFWRCPEWATCRIWLDRYLAILHGKGVDFLKHVEIGYRAKN